MIYMYSLKVRGVKMDLNDELNNLKNSIYGGDAGKSSQDEGYTDISKESYNDKYSINADDFSFDKYEEEYKKAKENRETAKSTYQSQFSELSENDSSDEDDFDANDKEYIESLKNRNEAKAPMRVSYGEAPRKKKKSPLQVPIIIACVILITAVLGFFGYMAFFAHSIVGDWDYKGDDDFNYHYTFDREGKVTMTLGSIEFVGQYATVPSEDVMKANINLYYGEIGGELEYDVTGSKILNNQVLTFSSGESTKQLKQSSKINFNEILSVPEDHKVDENLIGEWDYTFEDYNVNYKFVFKKDGTMQINQYDSVIYNCAYSAENNNIKCTFITTEETTQDIEYSCDGTVLEIMGLRCTRAGASTADQAMLG